MANCITGEGCKPMKYKDRKDFKKTFQKGAYRKIYPRQVSQYIVKELSENCYKVIWLKSVAEKYVSRETLEREAERKEQEWYDAELEKIFPSKKEKVRESEEKMAESVSRTKRIIWEYAICNVWEYFVTLTLDAEKVNRYDLREVYAKFRGMMTQINASVTKEEWGRQRKIEYVLIPEFHKNGAVHFHGLMRGFHKSDIRVNEHGKIEWRHWRDGFGFCNMQKIKDANAIAAYVTKYITKDMRNTVKEKGAHTFYASHGLKKPTVLYRGGGVWCGVWDYVSDDGYCAYSIVTRKELQNFIGEWGDII